jgi:hypothetical protein
LEKLNHLESIISTFAPQLLLDDTLSSDSQTKVNYSPSFKVTSMAQLSEGALYVPTIQPARQITMEPLYDPMMDFPAFTTTMTGVQSLTIEELQMDDILLQSAYRTSLDPYFSNLSLPGSFDYPSLMDFETHLVQLSALYYTGISPTADFKLGVLLHRSAPLPKYMRQALCFHSCFLSTHPALFPNGNPTMQDRIDAAQNYIPDVTKDNFSRIGTTNVDLCDTIRAMLVHTISQYSLGNGQVSTKILAKAFHYSKHFNILHPTTFGTASAAPTVDDLTTFRIGAVPAPKNISEIERAERLTIVTMLLAIDTYASIASGQGFVVNEMEYPDFELPNLPAIPPRTAHSIARRLEPTWGKFTVWENTIYAPAVDDAFEHASAISLQQPDVRVRSYLQIMSLKFMRKVIRYARTLKYTPADTNSKMIQLQFHSSVVQFLANIPSPFVAFTSLSYFVWGNPESQFPSIYTHRSWDVTAYTYKVMAMFSFLHFTSAMNNSKTKYAITVDGLKLYTSRDIIFAVFRALGHIISVVRDPNNAQKGVLEPLKVPYPPFLQATMMPPPDFSHTISALMCYVISTSTLSVFSCPDADPHMRKAIYDIATNLIMPVMDQLQQLWPNASAYYQVLQKQLNEYPKCE